MDGTRSVHGAVWVRVWFLSVNTMFHSIPIFSESSWGPGPEEGQCWDPDVNRNQPRPLRIPGPDGRRRRPQRAPVPDYTRSNGGGVGTVKIPRRYLSLPERYQGGSLKGRTQARFWKRGVEAEVGGRHPSQGTLSRQRLYPENPESE